MGKFLSQRSTQLHSRSIKAILCAFKNCRGWAMLSVEKVLGYTSCPYRSGFVVMGAGMTNHGGPRQNWLVPLPVMALTEVASASWNAQRRNVKLEPGPEIVSSFHSRIPLGSNGSDGAAEAFDSWLINQPLTPSLSCCRCQRLLWNADKPGRFPQRWW